MGRVVRPTACRRGARRGLGLRGRPVRFGLPHARRRRGHRQPETGRGRPLGPADGGTGRRRPGLRRGYGRWPAGVAISHRRGARCRIALPGRGGAGRRARGRCGVGCGLALSGRCGFRHRNAFPGRYGVWCRARGRCGVGCGLAFSGRCGFRRRIARWQLGFRRRAGTYGPGCRLGRRGLGCGMGRRGFGARAVQRGPRRRDALPGPRGVRCSRGPCGVRCSRGPRGSR